LDISSHDGDSLGMDSAEIGVFEQSDQISFSGFLESQNSAALESQFRLMFMGDFSDQPLER